MNKEKSSKHADKLSQRTASISFKTTPQVYDDMKEIAHLEKVKMVDVLERAIEAYKKIKKYDF